MRDTVERGDVIAYESHPLIDASKRHILKRKVVPSIKHQMDDTLSRQDGFIAADTCLCASSSKESLWKKNHRFSEDNLITKGIYAMVANGGGMKE